MGVIASWKQGARQLRQEAHAVYLAYRDPYAVGAAAYLLSPIDLIPDFIPLLGYLDALLIAPLLSRMKAAPAAV